MFSGLIRELITFGQEYDETKINNVLTATGLDTDLIELPEGIDTEIGERGVNLSGG